MSKTTYTVSLTFTDISEKSPLDATKKIVDWIRDGVDNMIFDVTDELTGEKFTVDLDDEDSPVLPNKD